MSPKNLTRSVVPAIDLYCRKASMKTLKYMSLILCSKSPHDRKTPVRSFLVPRCAVFEQVRTRLFNEGKINLFSVFLKKNSFAFCKMTIDNNFNTSLVNWQSIPIDYTFLPENRQRMSVVPTDTLCATEKIISLLGVSPKMTNFVSIERYRTPLMDFSDKLPIKHHGTSFIRQVPRGTTFSYWRRTSHACSRLQSCIHRCLLVPVDPHKGLVKGEPLCRCVSGIPNIWCTCTGCHKGDCHKANIAIRVR